MNSTQISIQAVPSGPKRADARRNYELILTAAMAEIAAGDHEFRPEPLDQDRRTPLDRFVVTRAEVKIGDVQDARGHRRGRL